MIRMPPVTCGVAQDRKTEVLLALVGQVGDDIKNDLGGAAVV